MTNLYQTFNLRGLLIFLVGLSLSSCVDYNQDERLKYFRSTRFKVDSLDKQYERDSLAHFSEKYNFPNIKDSSTLEKNVKEKYKTWYDWRDQYNEALSERSEERTVGGFYFAWYLSIGIGSILFFILRNLDKIKKKWSKAFNIILVIFLGWLGTSCYSWLFLNKLYPWEEISFLSISTQLKFLPFMLMWMINSAYIILMAYCLHRLVANVFYVFINYGMEYTWYSKNYGGKGQELEINKSDRTFQNLFIYAGLTFLSLYFYYEDSKVMSYFILERDLLSLESTEFRDYWWKFLIALLVVCYYFIMGYRRHKFTKTEFWNELVRLDSKKEK